MMIDPLHSLLRRQLKRCFGSVENVPAVCQPLVDVVNQAYVQSDADRLMLERSMALSSEELGGANAQLREAIRALRAAHSEMEARVLDRTRDLEAVHARLRQSQKMEAIGRLAGGIAHDFNNLLTAMMGYAELALARTEADPELTADILEIRGGCERAARLTQQLLAFSRKQVLQPQVLDLNQVIVEFERMLARVVGEHIRLQVVAGSELNHTRADRSQVEQLLMNLAVNARDAMRDGGTLKISTANAELDEAFALTHDGAIPGPYVSIRVEDTGCGMAPEILAHVFEPFFTTKGPGQGTGLGLATVYGVVNQSGGYITIDSAPNAGTTITTYLPVVDAPIDALPAAPHARILTGSETILLVEDEATVRSLMLQTLERYGYRVLDAGTGEEALALSEQHDGDIDLLLTDVLMPGMSGPGLAQRIVPARPRMKVLFVSGFPRDSIIDATALSPGISFLAKPFTSASLATAVRTSLEA